MLKSDPFGCVAMPTDFGKPFACEAATGAVNRNNNETVATKQNTLIIAFVLILILLYKIEMFAPKIGI
jgi:hypothetical protein